MRREYIQAYMTFARDEARRSKRAKRPLCNGLIVFQVEPIVGRCTMASKFCYPVWRLISLILLCTAIAMRIWTIILMNALKWSRYCDFLSLSCP